MSLAQCYVLACDMAGCQERFIGDRAAEAIRHQTGRRTVQGAFRLGWGMAKVGKFGQRVHICPNCRQKLCIESATKRFHQFIVDGDHTADHTVLLECKHEFSKVETDQDGTVMCPACYLAWWRSGEIIGTIHLNDLLPTIPE